MSRRPQREDDRPWYRQFWPWFLIAIPGLAVVSGVTTAVLAMREPPAMVVDDYARIGLATHRKQARDERAIELGLTGQLSVAGEPPRIEVTLGASQPLDSPDTLLLTFAHPTLSAQDLKLELTRSGETWSGQLHAMPDSRSYVLIEPLSGEWRLAGELPKGEHSLALNAAIAPGE